MYSTPYLIKKTWQKKKTGGICATNNVRFSSAPLLCLWSRKPHQQAPRQRVHHEYASNQKYDTVASLDRLQLGFLQAYAICTSDHAYFLGENQVFNQKSRRSSFPKDVALHNSTNLFQKRRTEEGKERFCHLLSLLRATRSYWVPGQRRPWRRGGRRGRRGWRRASSGTWRRIASPWTPAAGRRRWSLSPPPGAPSPPPTTTRPPARRVQHSLEQNKKQERDW